MAMKQNENDQ